MALDKEVRIGELTLSGSKAIKSIDPYGRHNYFAEQMKEVNGSMDGEISGKLRRPKYDEEQLLLAVDTEVDELIPNKPKDLPDVVLQSEYDALKAQIVTLNNIISDLRNQLSSAQSKISELESTISGLRAELDASLLRVTVAENSAEASADKFKQTSIDLQQAIQKSVAEAIERVSLEAQVEGLTAQKEALVQQVSALENQVQGKQAELAAGGEAAGNAFTVRVTPKTADSEPDIYFYSTRKGTRNPGFRNGPNVILTNTTAEEISVNMTKSGDKWLKLPSPSSFKIASGDKKEVKFGAGSMGGYKPKKWYHKSGKTYSGTVTITGGGETFTLNYKMKKHHG